MSVRMSFHAFVESKDPALIHRVVAAFELDFDVEGMVVAVSTELPGCWLTLTDGTGGVNFWGVLATAVPKGMVRWWEVSNSELDDPELDDTAFVRAFAADGTERWSAKLAEGVALEAAAPAIWTNARVRYLPDFSLALLDALPAAARNRRYWLHRVQALARLERSELSSLLRKLFAKGMLVGDIELSEALDAMSRGPRREEALKLFAGAVARARARRAGPKT